MALVMIYSKYGQIEAKPLEQVDIKKSIKKENIDNETTTADIEQ